MTVQIWLLTGTSLFFLLACGTRLSAVSDKAQIPQCPAVTSLLELPDMQACRQLMTLAEDPWQGCPALRPVVDPEGPASRCRLELSGGARALESQMHGHFAILSPAFNGRCCLRHGPDHILLYVCNGCACHQSR